MKKVFYNNEPSFKAQSATAGNAGRKQHTIMIKPCYQGVIFPCFESGFNRTLECPRVIRLEDMRQGIEEHTAQEFNELKYRQPLFYLQQMYGPDHRWHWNGYLLYHSIDKERARKVLAEHAHELNVILAFEDPDTDRYYFLIKTDAEELTDEAFLKYRAAMDWQLKQFFHKTIHHNLHFYNRVLTEDHYDIVNRDALFGKPEKPDEMVAMKEVIECEIRSCRTESVGKILKSVFGKMFKKS